MSARKARKKRKGCTQVDDTSDDTDYLKRQTFFDLLRKLGLKSPPSWFFGDSTMTEDDFIKASQSVLDNFGKPDMFIADEDTLEAYKKLFGGK